MNTDVREGGNDNVIIKISCCQPCGGVIRAAVKKEMTIKSRNSFMREVMEYNLSVIELPLSDYKKMQWCCCKNAHGA